MTMQNMKMPFFEDPSARLVKLLHENSSRIHVDKDGIVSIDYSNPEVIAEMSRQLSKLAYMRIGKNNR